MEIDIVPLLEAQRKPIPREIRTFGTVFSDRMFTQRYDEGIGWHDAKIEPYGPIYLEPSGAVFHYAQEIFEGTKAYRRPDGDINLFRPIENMKRFNEGARRMMMPQVDEEDHLEALIKLIELDHAWVPAGSEAALYIRPTMIATDPTLGVHASHSYLHFIIIGPVGPYFNTGYKPVAVYISDDYVRAVRGGTGDVKTGGNYAASLLVTEQVKSLGYKQVLWLDALQRRYVEEIGAMNIAFVYNGRHIVTPQLTGSILAGVTRDSVLRLAPDLGYTASEALIDVQTVLADIRSGEITEAFGMGTAAVIAPVEKFGFKGQDYVIDGGVVGPVAQDLYQTLTDIQYGRIPDPYSWTHRIYLNGDHHA